MLLPAQPARAAAALTITPMNWDVIGLDSNKPQTAGLINKFVQRFKVCNVDSAVTADSVKTTWTWVAGGSTRINLVNGTNTDGGATDRTTVGNLAPGACAITSYNLIVDTGPRSQSFPATPNTRPYTVGVSTTTAGFSATTALNRRLYVQKLVSQSRNAIVSTTWSSMTDGTNPCSSATACSVHENEKYRVTMIGKTSTGYLQTEQILNIPDNVFEVLSIKTTFGIPGVTINSEYADACGWAAPPTTTSPGSCIGPPGIPGGKAGGNPIKTVYTLKALSNAATAGAVAMNPMIVDNSGGSYHYNSDVATDAITVTPVKSSDLSITKTHANAVDSNAFIRNTSGTTTSGNRYTVTVTNNGPTATTGTITVADTLPTGLSTAATIGTSVSGTGQGSLTWSCPAAGATTISCTTSGSLVSGGSATLTIPITVPVGQAKGQVTNTATVSIAAGAGNSVDPKASNNTASDPTTIADPPDSDLVLRNTHTGNFTRGGTATWNLSLKNEGPTAVTSPQIVSTLPTGVTYTGFTDGGPGTPWSCSASGQVVTCNYSLGLNSGVTANSLAILGTVAASAGDTLTNVASATATGGTDPNTANNTNISDTAIVGQADVSLSIAHVGNLTIGSTGTFDFAVTNSGPDAASSPQLLFTLPAKLSYSSVNTAGWSCTGTPASPTTSEAQVVRCTRSTALASGATQNVNITVNVHSTATEGELFAIISGIACSGTVQSGVIGSQTIYSCPTVGGPGFATYDPDLTNNPADDAVNSYSPADMGVTATATASITAGNDITYTVTVTNNGPNTATNPFFALALPNGVTFNATNPSNSNTLSNAFTAPATPTSEVAGNFTTSCSYSESEIVCPPSAATTLASGQSFRATIIGNTSATTTPGGGAAVVATAQTGADQGDTNSANDSATASTTVSGGNVPPVVTFTGTPIEDEPESSTTTYTYNWEATDSTASVSSVVTSCGSAGTRLSNTITNATGDTLAAGNFVCKFDDGPASSDITVTATDNQALSSTATITFDVTNVAPTASLSAPSSASTSSNFTVSLGSPADVSSADTTAGFTYAFDCGSGYGDFGTATSTSCIASSSEGSVTVKGKIRDKDGGFTEYTQSVSIVGPPTADATSASLSHKSADGVDVALSGQDTSGANLTFSIVSGPAIGTLGSITGTNCTGTTTKTCTATVRYSNPGTDTPGNTSFTYKATRTGPVDSSAATATITRTNAAPTATVALSPASVTTNSTLTATATKNDADGDTTSLTYVWKVTRGSNTCTVKTTSGSAGLTDTLDLGAANTTTNCTGANPGTLNPSRDDSVEVFVTPNDGHVNGAEMSASKTVGNTAPTATVSLDADTPQTNDLLTATATKNDTDGDTVTLTYVWKVTKGNSTCTIKTTSASSGLTDTLALSSSFNTSGCTGSDLTNGTSYSPSKTDVVTVEVTPNDGTDNGTMVSDTATIANTAPTATVSLNTATPQTNDTLTATATKADADGDTVTLTYVWKVTKGNSTCTIKTTSGSAGLTDTLSLSSSFTASGCTGSDLTNGTSYNPAKTDIITVDVTPHDGTVSGVADSRTATIVNTPPTATVDLDPNSPQTNDTLTATATKADVDGDTVTLTYVWKITKGSSTCTIKTTSGSSSLTDSLNLSSSFTTSGCTGSDLTNGTSYNPARTDVVTVEVTPHDGTVSGSMVSDTATIANSGPVATDQTGGARATTNEDVSKTITLAGTDADGDTLTVKVTSLPSNGSLYDGPDASGYLITSSEATAGYTVTDASRRVTFVPTANYNNAATAFGPSFTFSVTDPVTASDAGTVEIDVDPVNDAPTWDASITMGSGGSLDLSTVSADQETADANLVYTLVGTDGGATKGTPAITGQTLGYVRDGGETGTDTVTVRVTDRGDPDNCGAVVAGACTAILNTTKDITIDLDNAAPVATAQTGASKVVTNEDTSKLITLAGTDADGDPLTFKITSIPSNGKLYKGNSTAGADEVTSASLGSPVTLAGATVTFVPNTHYNNGSAATGASFNFVAFDGSDTSAEAAVAIDVDPVNDTPAAANTTITTSSGSATVNLVNVTSDVETAAGDHVYKVTALPSEGTLKDGSTTITSGALPYTMTNGTTVTYLQPANDTSDDSFTYTATDRGDNDNCGTVVAGSCTAALTDPGTVTVDVTNAAPTATPQAGGTKVSVTEDSSVLITLAGTDPEGDTLTFKVTSLPSNGKLYKGASTAGADEITSASSGSPVTLAGTTATFVPTANYNNGSNASGPSFTFTATDAAGSNTASSAATVDIDVNPLNDSPTWDATVSMSATASLDLKDVSADFETPDANLTYAIVSNGSKGTASRTGSVITYTRAADQTGADSIVVSVTDRGDPDNCGTVVAGSCTAAVTVNKPVTINLQNTAPVATDQTGNDKAAMNEDASRTITLAGTDADGDTLAFKVTSLPSNGSLYDGPDATGQPITSGEATAGYTVTDASKRVTFVPTANYNNGANAFGPSFTFTVTDVADTDSGTVQIDVNPLNDTPTWDATITMGSGGSLDLSTVSADQETGDPDLAYTFVGTDGGAAKGTPAITGQTLTYVRDPGETGTDTVTVRVTDRGDPDNCGSVVAGACTATANATKAITINLDNETPVATPQTGGSKVTTNEDTSKLITLTGTDADGDTLTFKVTSLPSNGKLYKGASTAGADEIMAASAISPVTLTGATVTFVPTANYNNGSSAFGPSFTFTASDVTDTSAAATVQIDVDPVNDSTTAADGGITTSAGTASVNLVNLVTDGETTAATHVYKITALPASGTLKDGATTISAVPYTMANGTTVTYTQPANYNTDVSFTYSATDRGDPDNCGTVSGGACTASLTDSGTVSVDVTNAAPSASAQTLATTEDTAKLITLTGIDPETDTLTFKITALPTNGILKDGTTTITSGMLPRALTGALTYEPAANHNSGSGAPESFTFKSNDTFNDSANATVTIDVDPVNDTPTWDATVGVGAAGSLDLTTVSADIETLDASLSYSIVTNGTKGSATITGSTLTYSQSPDKNGTDTITVRVTDRGDPDNCGTVVSGSCTAVLTADTAVSITLVQTAPLATDRTGGSKIVIDEDDTGELITFAGTDAQNDTIAFKVTTLPSNGKLYVGNSTALADEIESGDLPATTSSVTFVPIADYNNGASAFGPSFTFSATDTLGSNSAGSGTVQVDVDPVNDQPTWNATVSMGEAASLNLRSASADVETADADLTYSIVTNGTKGTATLTGATLTYAKTAGQTGTDSVTVRVTDRGDPDDCGSVAAGACAAAKTADKTVSVSLDAAPVNNPPAASVTLHTLPNTGGAAVLTSAQAPKTNDKVRATSSCSDADGDNVTLTFVWKVTRLDNSVATVQTTTVPAGSCSGTYTDTLDLSKTGFGDKGETVKVEVTPNDGTVDGTVASGSTTVVVSDTPPTATDRVVRTGMAQAKEIVLEGSDIDGEAVTFSITQQPATGNLVVPADTTKSCFTANGTAGTRGSYTSPGTETCHLVVTYTPASGVTGSVTFKYKVENSAAVSRIATVTVEIEANTETGTEQSDDAEQATVQGALVSTGSEPSTDDPVETQIVAVRNGRIIITEEPVDQTPPSGFSFFAQQIDIQVLDANDDPVTTAADEPQRFSFLLDPSMLPTGKTVSDIEIYRNGTQVSECTGGSDLVQPTPACVLSRTLASGTIQIEVLTTAASTWHFAVPVPAAVGGGGGGPAPTPTPGPTDPPDPSGEPEAPLATLKIHDPKPMYGSMIRLTGKLRVCPGHEGTLLRLTAKIDGATEPKTLQTKRLDESCLVDYRVKAKFKKALFNVYWPQQDDDHHRGIGIPHWGVPRKPPGPLAVLWVSDRTPERGQLLTMYGWLRRCPGHGGTRMQLVAKIDGAEQAEIISTKTLDGRCRAGWTVGADFDRAIFNVRWAKQHGDHSKGNGRPHTVVTQAAV